MKKRFPNEGYELDWQPQVMAKFVRRVFIILGIVVAVSTFVVLMNNAAAINKSKTQLHVESVN